MKQLAVNIVSDEIEKSVKLLKRDLVQFPWEQKEYYAEWLAQTYYYVWRTTRFAALASAHCDLNHDFFHYAFIHALNEEKNHEKLLLNDLKDLNFQIEDFEEKIATSLFYQGLNYLMKEESHFSILGFSAFLERASNSIFVPILERLTKAYSGQAIDFLRVHCQLDQEHFKEAMELINKVPPSQLCTVNRAVKQACYSYRGILSSIINEKKSLKKNSLSNFIGA